MVRVMRVRRGTRASLFALAIAVPAAIGARNDAPRVPMEVIARAAGYELTTERLAGILGNAQLPVQRDVVGVLAELWVNYQLLGRAAAHADSLNDTTLVDAAMWASLSQARISRFYEIARRRFPMPDTTNLAEKYAQSDAFGAQHILIAMPQNGAGMSAEKQAGLRQKAEDLLKRATSENFSELATQYSEDPGSKNSAGTYAMFKPGTMLPEFEAAVRGSKPGEIWPKLVQTNYGFHVIRRHTLDEVRAHFIDYLVGTVEGAGRSQLLEKISTRGRVVVRPGIVPRLRELARYPFKFENDRTVLATSRLGNFTGAQFVKWMQAHPQAPQLRGSIVKGMADSSARNLVREFVHKELLIAEAGSEGVVLDAGEINQARASFRVMVTQAWLGLRVDPARLGDSATTVAQREQLAALRADEAIDRLLATSAQEFVDIPQQLAWALRQKYSPRINDAGLDRTVTRALAVRAALDSTRAKQAQAGNPGAPPSQPPPMKRGGE